ncbi:MAG: hypothetical protein A3D13_05135 [Planctomycetes bacterium RIFCSPHIGHO2_02_FULL_40_12]|nr:MAG: hypothetical protein A3D13_05135 [Planctomycetes bacterium RIFCSPHIGHO2_02_FULL_40_12]OHC03818.1 MAG: hypothetical protein A3H23_07465 [Planctomycetes bacterium RIFCSPLOWO2_12_FULL_40_19]
MVYQKGVPNVESNQKISDYDSHKHKKTPGIIPGNEVNIVSKGGDFVLKANPVENLKRIWKGRLKNKKSLDEYMVEIRGETE